MPIISWHFLRPPLWIWQLSRPLFQAFQGIIGLRFRHQIIAIKDFDHSKHIPKVEVQLIESTIDHYPGRKPILQFHFFCAFVIFFPSRDSKYFPQTVITASGSL